MIWEKIDLCYNTTILYMGQWAGSTEIQGLAYHLVSAKSLSEPMLTFSHLDSQEQTSVKFELKNFLQENAYQNVICKLIFPAGNVLLMNVVTIGNTRIE